MKMFNLGEYREPQCRVHDREQRADLRDGRIARTVEGIGPSNQGNARRSYRARCNSGHGTATRRSIARPALRRASRLAGARASRRRVSADVLRESNERFQQFAALLGGGSNLYGARAVDRVPSEARLVAKLGCLFRVVAIITESVRVRRDARS
jgi:histone H3/H4